MCAVRQWATVGYGAADPQSSAEAEALRAQAVPNQGFQGDASQTLAMHSLVMLLGLLLSEPLDFDWLWLGFGMHDQKKRSGLSDDDGTDRSRMDDEWLE